jgi:hypothetical protein
LREKRGLNYIPGPDYIPDCIFSLDKGESDATNGEETETASLID